MLPTTEYCFDPEDAYTDILGSFNTTNAVLAGEDSIIDTSAIVNHLIILARRVDLLSDVPSILSTLQDRLRKI